MPLTWYVLMMYIYDSGQNEFIHPQYRIDINQGSISPVEARPYTLGTPMDPPSNILLPYPLSITAKEKYVYFLPQESFNLGGMLLNPMMLAMIFCGILVLAMPYIMVSWFCSFLTHSKFRGYVIQKNLDPETLEEFKKEQTRLSRTIQQGNTNSRSVWLSYSSWK